MSIECPLLDQNLMVEAVPEGNLELSEYGRLEDKERLIQIASTCDVGAICGCRFRDGEDKSQIEVISYE